MSQYSSFSILHHINDRRGFVFGSMILLALLAFEAFNYTTTDYALSDLLGGLEFLGIHWATILALAFCGIDFAGIARLFTPEEGTDSPNEVWYLFAAWLLAATMNAMLTWWGISLAILNHESLGNAIFDRSTLLRTVPIFVAVMVWLIRVLMIGTFSLAGDRLFSQSPIRRRIINRRNPIHQTGGIPEINNPRPAQPRGTPQAAFRPAPKPGPVRQSEPTYHPIAMSMTETNESAHSQYKF
jgi:hypothetical protein